MRVLLAPHAFGPLLPPAAATAALAAGWSSARPADELVLAPMSDGAGPLVDAWPADGAAVTALEVPGPSGGSAVVRVLERGGTVVLDGDEALAAPDADPRHLLERGTTAGLGLALAHAIGRPGVRRVVVGLGSAGVHDGGAGLIRALAIGLGLTGPEQPAALVGPLRDRLGALRLLVAAADDAPLVGLTGAGAALGDRPGLDAALAQAAESAIAAQVAAVEDAAERAAPPSLLVGADRRRLSRRPFAGAGGGAAFALAALGATVQPGARVLATERALTALADGVDLVVTGAEVVSGHELGSGVVAEVAERAAHGGVPVVVIGGDVEATRRQLAQIGVHGSYEVRDRQVGVAPQARPYAAEELADRAARVARTWSR